MKNSYIIECKKIRQNANYTAEAHYYLAQQAKKKVLWLEIIPSIVIVLSNLLILSGVSNIYCLSLSIIASTVIATAAFLNPNLEYGNHLSAAKAFNLIKNDASFLCDTELDVIDEEDFIIKTKKLRDKYNNIIQLSPSTDEKSFNHGKERIKEGVHDQDKDENGNIL